MNFFRGEHFLRIAEEFMVELNANLRLPIVEFVGVGAAEVFNQFEHMRV